MAAGVRTQSGAVLGTPAYMAPEQAEGKSKKVGKAADVYALGAILYECLTGRPPFQADTLLDTLVKVATEEPPPPRQVRPTCPRDLETICLKCLEKTPGRRYASAGALADDLKRYLEGEPIEARPPGKLERLGRALKRRKELAFLAGGALLAACAVLVVLAVGLLSRLPGPSADAQAVGPSPEEPADKEGGPPDEEDDPAGRVRDAARRTTSMNNLKHLALAMQSMHDNHTSFPPAAITEARTGKPLLSWRVAVLPFIEQDVLYRQFRLDEAWDGPNNKKLLGKMPKTFEVPDAKTPQPHSTFYQVFVGPQTAFEPQAFRRQAPFGFAGQSMFSITDGTSNTILIAEAGEAVPWTKPVDLAYDPRRPLPKLGGAFKDRFHVAMADAKVLAVSTTVSEKTLRAAITRNAGDLLGADWPNGTVQSREAATVSGQVFYKGVPLPGGVITLHPRGTAGKRWSGQIGKKGSYKIQRAVPGDYTITVTTGPEVGVRIPAKYADAATSPLRRTLRPKSEKLDLSELFDIQLRD
jgi:hypothetical protein